MTDDQKPQRHAPRGPLKTRADLMAPIDPMRLRCKATNRQGNQCGQRAIHGGTVCRMHGGAAPQVKNKAEERLRALEMPAIHRMGQLIDQKEFPSVAYQASRDVLDRLRGKPTEFVETTVTNIGNLSDDELMAKATALLEAMRGSRG